MARTSGQVVQNQFVKGLITEATGLNFPENACLETWNCKFNKRGAVTRRLGIEYEDDYVFNEAVGSDGVVKEYVWKGVGTNGLITFVVVQQGSGISFYEPDGAGNISANIKNFSVDLLNYMAETATQQEVQQEACEFASGKGRLFINHPRCEPIYVVYDADADSITTTEYEILIRDFEGVDDNLTTEERPSTLTTTHEYNLHNQGWYQDVECGTGTNSLESEGVQDPIVFYHAEQGVYPSNSDIWWLFKDSAERFNKRRFDTVVTGSSPAPKGHFVDNAFYFDRSAVSGISGQTLDTSSGYRPGAVAFFAGRVWYSGVNHRNYTGRVYYTQIIESDLQIGVCHQRNDPTSEHLSDLLDTDGGVIDILEAANIVKLISIQDSLLIFATNGVWAITGSQGTGFLATDFSVSKLSSVPCLSNYNFVTVDGFPLWWNYTGIYAIVPSEAGTALNIQSLTDDTIKDFFQDILADSIKYAKGAYNPSERVVQWIYRSNAATEFIDNFTYDRFLNFNAITQAFYPWNIEASTSENPIPAIRGIVCLDSAGVTRAEENVVDNDDALVVDASSNQVTAEVVEAGSALAQKFKYIVTGLLVPEGGGGASETYTGARVSDYANTSPVSNEVSYVVDRVNRLLVSSHSTDPIHVWNLADGTVLWSKLDSADSVSIQEGNSPIFDYFGNVHFGQSSLSSGIHHSYNLTTGVYNGTSFSANPGLAGWPTKGSSARVGNTTYLFTGALATLKFFTTTNGTSFTTVATNTSVTSINFGESTGYCFRPPTVEGVTTSSRVYWIDNTDPTNMIITAWGSTTDGTHVDIGTAHGITDTYAIWYYAPDDTIIHWGPEGLRKLDADDPTISISSVSLAYTTGTFGVASGLAGFDDDGKFIIWDGAGIDTYYVYQASDLSLVASYAVTLWDATDFADSALNKQTAIWLEDELGIVSLPSASAYPRIDYLPGSGESLESPFYRITFAEEWDTLYHDWTIHKTTVDDEAEGIDYDSTFLTGAQVPAEGDKHFNIEYITVFSEVEANSSCYLQGRWDYANSSNASKWSTQQQVYSTQRETRDVIRKRLLVRGQGPALYLYFRSEEGKPFNIIGWSAWETADDST